MTSLPRPTFGSIERPSELLAAQSEIIEALGGSGHLPDLLARVATAIERVAAPARCSILLVDESGRLRHGAAPSLPDSYSQANDGIAIGPQAGSCGTAAYRRQPVIVRDIATDPLWASCKHLPLRHGLRACWSMPILGEDGAVLGVVALYHAEPREPGVSDRTLLDAITPLIRLALIHHRKEAALRESEARYRLLAENASDVIIRLVVGGERLYVSPSVTAMLGYEPWELIGTASLTMVHPDDAEETQTALRTLVPDGPPVTCIHRIRRKDGTYIWAEFVARQVNVVAGRPEIIGVIREITVRRATEERLRESEALNRSVVESSADCIKILDLDGNLLFMNGPGQRALEIEDFERLRGCPWAGLWPAAVRPEVQAALAAAKAGQVARFTAPCPTTRGKPRWWNVAASPVPGGDGRPVRLVAISRDVTAQQQAEMELREAKQRAEAAERQARQARERLEQAVEMLPEGFVLFGPDDRVVLCNSKLRNMYTEHTDLFVPGASFEGIIRESVARGFFVGIEGREEQWIADRIADHREPRSARELSLANGHWLRVEERRMPDGSTVGVRIDITDLKDREASFKLLFNANPVPMWVFDRTTLRFLEVNQAAVRHYGYSREQFLSMSILDIRPPDEVGPLQEALRSAGALRTLRRTWRHRRADGSIIEVEITGHWLTFQGRPAEIVASFDVTDRNRTETALREAKEEAEAANRTKSQFLATMSHELRTPLNAILGFSEIIRDARMGPVDPRYRGYARDVHASGQHLLGLINDILDLSKVEVGRLEIYEERVDLREMLSACVRLVIERARSGGVALETQIGQELPPIVADRLRFKQILLNLLSNAVKFTPAGGRVTVTAAAPVGGNLTITVADTGIGMRPEDIPIALEPFRQIESAQNRRYEGTGLGLPLAQRLVGLHGGALCIESAPGVGTTIRVSLPESRVVRSAG